MITNFCRKMMKKRKIMTKRI